MNFILISFPTVDGWLTSTVLNPTQNSSAHLFIMSPTVKSLTRIKFKIIL